MVKYICIVKKWFDKVNENTYHSVKIVRCKDNKIIKSSFGFTYDYDDAYRQTALEVMLINGWLPKKYNKKNLWLYERENKYPIFWDASYGLKRECISNIS